MRDMYVNKSRDLISVISLSTTDGTALNVVWKKRKNTRYVFELGSKKNVI
ncbi:MAG: hypothetical protein ACRD8Z_15670 [Nitrososphaeraceae archaeon]